MRFYLTTLPRLLTNWNSRYDKKEQYIFYVLKMFLIQYCIKNLFAIEQLFTQLTDLTCESCPTPGHKYISNLKYVPISYFITPSLQFIHVG